MQEGAREIVVQAQGPPLWIYFLAPVATVLTTLVGFAVFYFLGRSQMRAQVRHEKAVEAIVEFLRVIRDLGTKSGVWSLYHERSDPERENAEEILRLRGKLQELVYDNSPWFEPETERKMRPVLKQLPPLYKDHREAIRSKDRNRAKETGDRLREWSNHDLINMEIELEDEARRLIGTKRRWSLTWWGRPLAWFTRTTRFSVVRNWVRRNIGWLLAVPLPVLVLLGVALYVLMARSG